VIDGVGRLASLARSWMYVDYELLHWQRGSWVRRRQKSVCGQLMK